MPFGHNIPFLSAKKTTTAKETIRQGWPFGPPAQLALRVLDRSSRRGALMASRGEMSLFRPSGAGRHASGGSPGEINLVRALPTEPGA
jgi:hypothetical protein